MKGRLLRVDFHSSAVTAGPANIAPSIFGKALMIFDVARSGTTKLVGHHVER
jgi:hypothetical protein